MSDPDAAERAFQRQDWDDDAVATAAPEARRERGLLIAAWAALALAAAGLYVWAESDQLSGPRPGLGAEPRAALTITPPGEWGPPPAEEPEAEVALETGEPNLFAPDDGEPSDLAGAGDAAGDTGQYQIIRVPETTPNAEISAVAPANASAVANPPSEDDDEGGGLTLTPPPNAAAALAPAPIDGLASASAFGPLPVIAPDGRRPWRLYGARAETTSAPRVALIIGGVGLKRAASAEVIRRLPPEVTLSLVPYAGELAAWAANARAHGHEILLEAPMEPIDYPETNPGAHTLLTSLTPAQNIERLQWLMGRFTGYVGVTNYLGRRFSESERTVKPVLEELRSRGLMYLDNRASPRSVVGRLAGEVGLPYAAVTLTIDSPPSPEVIAARLAELEALARTDGVAIGVGLTYQATIDATVEWAAGLEARGVVLTPVSALAGAQ